MPTSLPRRGFRLAVLALAGCLMLAGCDQHQADVTSTPETASPETSVTATATPEFSPTTEAEAVTAQTGAILAETPRCRTQLRGGNAVHRRLQHRALYDVR